MLRWNTCPRCKGDVRIDRDEYGWYEECLMCGYHHDVAVQAHDRREEAGVREKVAVRVRRPAHRQAA